MCAALIGSSPEHTAVLDAIALVSRVDSTVLVLGETGTGKELVARAIHEASARRKQRFVAVNCAAIPASLLETELFGHERGAFTGAVAQTSGRFQAAHHGTLFLDEVGDLPLEMQPKLLRALQERQVERLGSGGRSTPIDARVIAATHQDLWAMVERGAFREDLYYRLNVFPIFVPPLRERQQDIPLLVAHFVREFAQRHGKGIDNVPEAWVESLKGRTWRGNIRELQNVVERAVITAADGVLRASAAERERGAHCQTRSLADLTRAHILATLRETDWVVGGVNGAAARLGLCRTTLIAKMERLGITKDSRERSAARHSDASEARRSRAPHCDCARDFKAPCSGHASN